MCNRLMFVLDVELVEAKEDVAEKTRDYSCGGVNINDQIVAGSRDVPDDEVRTLDVNDEENSEVGLLSCKVKSDVERQVVEQSEDLSSLVSKNVVDQKRLTGEGIVDFSASRKLKLKDSKVDRDFTSSESDGGTLCTSERCSEYRSRLSHLSHLDNDNGYKDLASHGEDSRWNASDGLNGSPVHDGNVLLSKDYVHDLLAEIAALKRTVIEQSRYLRAVDYESAAKVCVVSGKRVSTVLAGEDICNEKPTNIYHGTPRRVDKPVTSVLPLIFDARNRDDRQTGVGQVQYRQVMSGVEENSTTSPRSFELLVKRQVQSKGIDELEQAKDTRKASGSPKFEEAYPCSSPDEQQTKIAASWTSEHRAASFDEGLKASFHDTKLLQCVDNVVPSRLKRTTSEGGVDEVEFAGKPDAWHPGSRHHFNDKAPNFDSREQCCVTVSKEVFQEEHSLQLPDACLHADETDNGTELNSDEYTAKKFNALLADMRTSCDLERGGDDGEIDRDVISIDELLLLVNSYERLKNDKNILENENRILGMEIDELAMKLMKTEEDRDGTRLPSISEENLEEQLAEMEDRLEVKEAELSQLREALAESKGIPQRKIIARQVQTDEEIATANSAKLHDCTLGENDGVIQETSQVVPKLDKNLNSKLAAVWSVACQEYGDGVKCGGQLQRIVSGQGNVFSCSERKVMKNDGDVDHFVEKERLTAQLCHLNQEESVQPEVLRLEAENRRLRQEVEQWKQMRQFHGDDDDVETMFCVQERLASELQQLSEKLESTRSELAERNTAYQRLEVANGQLEQANKLLIDRVSLENRGIRSEKITGVDLRLVANSNLVDELTVRPALGCETDGLNTDVLLNRMNADEDTVTRYRTCGDGISNGEPSPIHDSTSIRLRITENGANTISSEIKEQELMTQPKACEEAQRIFDVVNGHRSQMKTATYQSATDTDDVESHDTSNGLATRTAYTTVLGATSRPAARDLVCRDMLYLIRPFNDDSVPFVCMYSCV